MLLTVLVIVVWALVLGLSPGLTLTAVACATLALDAFDSSLVDRFLGHVG